MLDRHIFLIGMPGSGKSSLGRKVAHNLRLTYRDIDIEIQNIAGCGITDFFERFGETAFRTAETNYLSYLTRVAPGIISCGGGTPMRDENLAIMRASGLIVFIDRPIAQIMGDIRLEKRPLLAQKGIGEVEKIYNERIGRYRAAADVTLDNSLGFASGMQNLERLLRQIFAI